MVSQHQPHPLLSMAVKLPVWPIFMKQAGCAKESTPRGHIFTFFMMMVSQNIHKRGHRKTNRKTPLLQSQVLKRPSHYVSRGGSHKREHQGSGFNLVGEEQRDRERTCGQVHLLRVRGEHTQKLRRDGSD